MFVRLNDKKIDLRDVRSVERVSDTQFKITYVKGNTENIAITGKEPKNTLDLMNALLVIFEDIEIYEKI